MLPLSATSLTRQRFAAQTIGSDGRPLAQTPTSTTMLGSVQPADSRMECTAPGYSGEQRRRVYLFAEVLIADEGTGRPADRLVLSDGAYLVWWVQRWPGLGPIAEHWEAEVYLVQPINPPAGSP